MAGIAAYSAQLRQLLPRGRAWLSAPGSIMSSLLESLAAGMERVDQRTADLIRESSPLTALELLPDWERVAGLPDACLPTSGTITERQLRVARKLAGIGGQSRAYFIELAAQLGIAIEIQELSPFRAGMRAGLPCNSVEWTFAWRVRVLPFSETSELYVRSSWFRAGAGRAGDRIRSFSITELECLFRRAAPAHTKVLFSYPVDPEPIFWFDFLSDQGDY